MALKLQFARILGAAAVLAAFSLAPSVASAHAGHAHARAAVSVTYETPASKVVAFEVTAAPALPSMRSDNANCSDRGCCSNGPCTGCHGFTQVTVPLSIPPLSSSSLVIRDAPPRASPLDGRLRRPPKSFV
jgi:hypothetical protein